MARFNRKKSRNAGAFVQPEALEGRAMMAVGALPQLSDLSDPNNTVVQIRTTLGTVNVELFDSEAPLTIAAFLQRVGRGDLDTSIFGKLNGKKTLEAGAFKFREGSGLFAVPQGAPLASEGSMLNAARTIALSRTTDNTGSSTGTFFINLKANNNLNSGASRTTVIGRIADDASWDIVKAITKLKTKDLDVALTGLEGQRFNKVPVLNKNIDNNSTPAEIAASLLRVEDVEVVKAQGSNEFFTNSISYSEGFSGLTVDEFLPLVNSTGNPVDYQVILRFEFDPANPFAKRDAVVSTGTIPANSRGGATIWRGAIDFPASNADSLITPGRPYAIEVRSTGPLGGTLSHYDFGTATGESLSGEPSKDWAIAGGVKGGDNRDFLVWYNPNVQVLQLKGDAGGSVDGSHDHSVDGSGDHGSVDIDASEIETSITLTFYPEGRAPLAPMTFTLESLRRGGLSINDLAELPEGRFSVRIQSDIPIIAALSHYNPSGTGQGATSVGASGGTTSSGVMPLATFGANPATQGPTVTFLNPGQGNSVPSLGAAGQYAAFAMNSTKIKLKDGGTTINGHAASQGARGKVEFDHGGTINGRLDISDGVDVETDGIITGPVALTDLSGAFDDASAAAAIAAGDTPTQSFKKVSKKTGTIVGNGGLNVIQVRKDLKLDHGTLTLSGSADDVFIINVHGKMELKHQASIVLAGGLTANHVLFNVVGKKDVKITDSSLSGTILAPRSSFDMDGGTLTGAVIAGKDKLELKDGAVIDYAPFDAASSLFGASIDLTLHFENPMLADLVLPGALTVPAGQSVSARLDTLIPNAADYAGQRFTVTYHSSSPVFAGMSQTDAFDGTATAVATTAATHQSVGEGFMDAGRAGVSIRETLAIHNPGSAAAGVTVRLHFEDGFTLDLLRTVEAGRTSFIDLHTEQALLDQTANNRFFYSIEVLSDAPVAAVFQHLDTNLGREGGSAGGFSTLMTVIGESTVIDNMQV